MSSGFQWIIDMAEQIPDTTSDIIPTNDAQDPTYAVSEIKEFLNGTCMAIPAGIRHVKAIGNTMADYQYKLREVDNEIETLVKQICDLDYEKEKLEAKVGEYIDRRMVLERHCIAKVQELKQQMHAIHNRFHTSMIRFKTLEDYQVVTDLLGNFLQIIKKDMSDLVAKSGANMDGVLTDNEKPMGSIILHTKDEMYQIVQDYISQICDIPSKTNGIINNQDGELGRQKSELRQLESPSVQPSTPTSNTKSRAHVELVSSFPSTPRMNSKEIPKTPNTPTSSNLIVLGPNGVPTTTPILPYPQSPGFITMAPNMMIPQKMPPQDFLKKIMPSQLYPPLHPYVNIQGSMANTFLPSDNVPAYNNTFHLSGGNTAPDPGKTFKTDPTSTSCIKMSRHSKRFGGASMSTTKVRKPNVKQPASIEPVEDRPIDVNSLGLHPSIQNGTISIRTGSHVPKIEFQNLHHISLQLNECPHNYGFGPGIKVISEKVYASYCHDLDWPDSIETWENGLSIPLTVHGLCTKFKTRDLVTFGIPPHSFFLVEATCLTTNQQEMVTDLQQGSNQTVGDGNVNLIMAKRINYCYKYNPDSKSHLYATTDTYLNSVITNLSLKTSLPEHDTNYLHLTSVLALQRQCEYLVKGIAQMSPDPTDPIKTKFLLFWESVIPFKMAQQAKYIPLELNGNWSYVLNGKVISDGLHIYDQEVLEIDCLGINIQRLLAFFEAIINTSYTTPYGSLSTQFKSPLSLTISSNTSAIDTTPISYITRDEIEFATLLGTSFPHLIPPLADFLKIYGQPLRESLPFTQIEVINNNHAFVIHNFDTLIKYATYQSCYLYRLHVTMRTEHEWDDILSKLDPFVSSDVTIDYVIARNAVTETKKGTNPVKKPTEVQNQPSDRTDEPDGVKLEIHKRGRGRPKKDKSKEPVSDVKEDPNSEPGVDAKVVKVKKQPKTPLRIKLGHIRKTLNTISKMFSCEMDATQHSYLHMRIPRGSNEMTSPVPLTVPPYVLLSPDARNHVRREYANEIKHKSRVYAANLLNLDIPDTFLAVNGCKEDFVSKLESRGSIEIEDLLNMHCIACMRPIRCRQYRHANSKTYNFTHCFGYIPCKCRVIKKCVRCILGEWWKSYSDCFQDKITEGRDADMKLGFTMYCPECEVPWKLSSLIVVSFDHLCDVSKIDMEVYKTDPTKKKKPKIQIKKPITQPNAAKPKKDVITGSKRKLDSLIADSKDCEFHEHKSKQHRPDDSTHREVNDSSSTSNPPSNPGLHVIKEEPLRTRTSNVENRYTSSSLPPSYKPTMLKFPSSSRFGKQTQETKAVTNSTPTRQLSIKEEPPSDNGNSLNSFHTKATMFDTEHSQEFFLNQLAFTDAEKQDSSTTLDWLSQKPDEGPTQQEQITLNGHRMDLDDNSQDNLLTLNLEGMDTNA